MTFPKVLENWRIIPARGGEICIIHNSGQTSNIKQMQEGNLVMTENKSVYKLSIDKKNPGIWETELAAKRPNHFNDLQKYKIL